MASAYKGRELLLCAAVAFATAVLLWFGNGLNPIWSLMWVAPLPSMWFSLQTSSWRRAAGAACFGWLLGSTSMLAYFHAQGTPFLAWLTDFGLFSLIFALGVVAFRWFMRRGATWSAVAVLPALWTAMDWLRYWITPHGISADLAYTQLRFLPFLQLASLTGPWGMTFCLLWMSGAIAAFLYLRRRDARQAWQLCAWTSAVMIAVFAFGTMRLLRSTDEPAVTMGLITSDVPANEDAADAGPSAFALLSAYAAQTRALAAKGASIILMPEKIAVVRDADRDSVDAALQQVADATQATLVAGELHVSPTEERIDRFNRVQVYEPHAISVSYDKEHMLPPFESGLVHGTLPLTFASSGSLEGVAICKDMDFTSTGLKYGRLHVGVMLVPGWDFRLDRVWHGHMAIMRGVESGFAVVRAAKESSLFVSDAYGRIIAEKQPGSAVFTTLIAKVPTAHHNTLFQLWGDWFAWFAAMLLAVLLVRAVLLGRRNPRSATSIPK